MAGPNYNMLLGVSQPDLIDIRDRANMAAQREIESQNQNALTGYLRQNGAAIMAGDQNALAGYAQFDPAGALGIQGTRQNMAQSREEFAIHKAEIARRIQAELEAKRNEIDQKALEAERAQLEKALVGAGTFYSRGDREGYNRFLTSLGADPAQYPFESFEATAAQYQGVLDGISKWQKAFQPEGPEWVDLTPEELAQYGLVRGQRNSKTGKIEGSSPPKGQSISLGADGSLQITEGVGIGGKADKALAAAEMGALASDIVLEDIDRAKKLVSGQKWWDPVTGPLSIAGERVRGSSAANYRALANTIAGNIAFDKLQRMREASPTGGALGSVSKPELDMLEAALGSISNSQDDAQLLENLTRLETIYADIARKFAAYPGQGSQIQGAVPQPAQAGPARRRFNPATGAFE